MKKVIIGLSGLIVLTFLIIITVNAQSNDQKSRKANTEVSRNISPCPSSATCQGLSGSKIAGCNSSKCSAMDCNLVKCKEVRCDPATCKGGNCDPSNCKGGNCNQVTCKTNFSGASTGMLSGPMNCNR